MGAGGTQPEAKIEYDGAGNIVIASFCEEWFVRVTMGLPEALKFADKIREAVEASPMNRPPHWWETDTGLYWH